jgi:hypothetical protein
LCGWIFFVWLKDQLKICKITILLCWINDVDFAINACFGVVKWSKQIFSKFLKI